MNYDKRDSAEIRKLILEVLEEIKSIISIEFEIAVADDTRFGENITMQLAPESSGITKPGKEKDESYERSGAKIVFHQIYSNGTEVSYRMSHIEGLTEEAKAELQDKIPRKHISRKYIMEKVLNFLETVKKFEQ